MEWEIECSSVNSPSFHQQVSPGRQGTLPVSPVTLSWFQSQCLKTSGGHRYVHLTYEMNTEIKHTVLILTQNTAKTPLCLTMEMPISKGSWWTVTWTAAAIVYPLINGWDNHRHTPPQRSTYSTIYRRDLHTHTNTELKGYNDIYAYVIRSTALLWTCLLERQEAAHYL